MWQEQVVDARGVHDIENDAYAQSPQNQNSKWWHVEDGQIEDLIRRLNNPLAERLPKTQATQDKATAATVRSAQKSKTLPRGSVRFNEESAAENDTTDLGVGAEEDALDKALRENDEIVETKQAAPAKRGAWKVANNANFDDFVEHSKKVAPALVPGLVPEASGLSCGYPAARSTALPKCAHLLASPSRLDSLSKLCVHSPTKPGLRKRPSKTELTARPPWEKSLSTPSLFAGAAKRPDGKGNIISKPGMTKYEETPIYLSDAKDKCLENVRVAVCGHPYYM